MVGYQWKQQNHLKKYALTACLLHTLGALAAVYSRACCFISLCSYSSFACLTDVPCLSMYVRLNDVFLKSCVDMQRAAGSRADSTNCFLVMLIAVLPGVPVTTVFKDRY